MKPALSQVCSLPSPLEKDLEDYAAGTCPAVEIWLGKLESWLATHREDEFRELLQRCEIAAPVASFQGGLLVSQGAARQEHWSHFERRLALCERLGIATLVVAADVQGPQTETDLRRAQASLAQAAELAARYSRRLALEFQAQASWCNNLQTAAALVAQCGAPNLGVCLDVFHYYLGPSKLEDLGYLSAENLFHVQVSDLAGEPREMATDASRVLPGDGDFQWPLLMQALRQIGYDGYVAVETLNPVLWQIPARQFGEVAMNALRQVLAAGVPALTVESTTTLR